MGVVKKGNVRLSGAAEPWTMVGKKRCRPKKRRTKRKSKRLLLQVALLTDAASLVVSEVCSLAYVQHR